MYKQLNAVSFNKISNIFFIPNYTQEKNYIVWFIFYRFEC